MLFDALEAVTAWRVLHDPKASGEMDADGILELCKQAGYSEEASQKAAEARANARMDRDLPP